MKSFKEIISEKNLKYGDKIDQNKWNDIIKNMTEFKISDLELMSKEDIDTMNRCLMGMWGSSIKFNKYAKKNQK